MNRSFYMTAIAVFALPLACDDTAEGIRKDTREALNNAAEEAQEVARDVERATENVEGEADEFRAERRDDIKELEDRIEELDERARTASTSIQAEAVDEAREFEQRRAALEAQLEQLQAATGQQWEEAKARVNDGIRNLGQDVERALERVNRTSARAVDME